MSRFIIIIKMHGQRAHRFSLNTTLFPYPAVIDERLACDIGKTKFDERYFSI